MKVNIHSIHIPNLCEDSIGIVQVSVQNPSYCAPLIGPIDIAIYSNHTKENIGTISVPEFRLESGSHVIQSSVQFQVLISASEMHSFIQQELKHVQIRGDIPIQIQCLLVPFTVHLQVAELIQQQQMRLTSINTTNIAEDIQEIIKTILRTIGLHKVHINQQKDSITAFTDVEIEYDSMIHWTIPPITIGLTNSAAEQVLYAGFQEFSLGIGKSTISAFTSVLKKDSEPLEHLFQSLLTGHDIHLSVSGADNKSTCFVQQVLNEFQVPIRIPGTTIHGKPILLQQYNVSILPRKIDSHTKTCNITAEVTLLVNNPLPIDIEIDRVSMEARFRAATKTQPDFLFGRIKHDEKIIFEAHKTNTITFHTELVEFYACQELIHLLFQHTLSISLIHGKVAMHVAGTSFIIPFTVHDINPIAASDQAVLKLA